MDNDKIDRRQKTEVRSQTKDSMSFLLPSVFCCLFSITYLLFSISCSSTDIKREIRIPEEYKEVKPEIPVSELNTPEFVPVTEDVSPVKTRLVDISARNTPLRDVLYVIAEATELNLVMEKGVLPETPITLTMNNVSAEDALNAIFASVDYFYSIKGNMLIVKAMDTKIFELGHPAIVQTYSVDVGGDILGGAIAGNGGASSIKGSIAQTSKSDTTAFNFWDGIEKSIGSILGTTTAVSSQTATAVRAAVESSAVQQGFTVNRLTGTIVVSASKRNIERVEHYLNAVRKIINRQVLVEAKIIEVQLSDGLRYGIDWSFVNRALGDGQISITTQDFSNVIPTALPYITIGVTRGTSFSSLLKALREQGDVRTLSNPRVNIINGQTALLSVGRNVSFISKVTSMTTTTAGAAPTTTFTVDTSSVLSGIAIGLVPFINENREISLTVTPIISNLVSLEEKSVGQTGNQTTISLPTVDLRELSTTVKVRDGQMVVIGGLIQREESLQDKNVPAASDIPLLGYLFKQRTRSEAKTELVILLRPVIVSM